MGTQTFQADSVTDALQDVQRELGPDALVISVREVPGGPAWQVWRRPMIEVVALSNEVKRPEQVAELDPQPASKSGEKGHGEPVRWQPPVYQHSAKNRPQPETPGPANENMPIETRKNGGDPAKAVFPYIHSKSASNLEQKDAQVAPIAVPALTHVEKPTQSRLANPTPPDPAFINQKPKQAALSDALVNITQRLLNQGLDEKIVRRLVTTCVGALSQAAIEDEDHCRNYFKKTLEVGVREQHKLLASVPNRLMVLVGASGSGKTSTVARLAAYYSRSLGKKVLWISADTVRTGAISETHAYADALSVPIQFVYTPDELAQSVNNAMESDHVDLILVDTPGLNPCSEVQMAELGGLLTRLSKRMTYLVAPATTKGTDLNQMAAALAPFTLHGLIVTKLDETFSYGNIYNFAVHSQLPLAYFTSGKQILGDFHLADVSSLVDALFGEGWITRGKLQ